MKKILLLIAFFFTAVFFSFAQQWVKMMKDPNANLFEVQKEFQKHFSSKTHILEKMMLASEGKAVLTEGEKAELAGWKQFKRWEWFMLPRVGDDGKRFAPDAVWKEIHSLKTQQPATIGNWALIGPSVVPNTGGGAGRINCVRFDPSNFSIVYAGSPSGGLWKSTDGGNTWTLWNTDFLGSIGVTDIAIDPNNSQNIFLATGDGDAGDTYSIGVLKSTDGGLTWNTTGLNWSVTSARVISRLLIDPTNSQILHAATDNGLYRSTNGGTSWTVSIGGPFMDLEFKSGDPTILHATDNFGKYYRSTDGGQTFAQAFSPAGAGRIAVAVTPANPVCVYLLVSNSSDNGFGGLYRSLDDGVTFTLQSSFPNVLGWSNTGSDVGGQGWYDLALAASPTNANEIIAGGVNVWRSTNAGSSWSIIGHWTGTGAPYVHADIHDLIFLPGNGTTVYAGCDGGVFFTQNNGGSWSDRSAGLEIAQMYRLGQSATNGSLVIQGWQDNGTNRWNGIAWDHIVGGDGMECFIDRTNNNVMYAELQNGGLRRSIDGGSTWSTITSGLTGAAAWVTPWQQDPQQAATLWVAYEQVFKSINQGSSWTQIGTVPGAGSFIALKVAPSNNQVIYLARNKIIYKSTNGGSTWSTAMTGISTTGVNFTYLEVNPNNENHVWVTVSGYVTGKQVYESKNGGANWTNISAGLPALPANCIVYEQGSPDGVYIGMDAGVYYKDSTMASWIPFNTGLPNVVINELEIQYTVNKLRAATYGRGLWQSDLYGTFTGVFSSKACADECINIFPNPSTGIFSIVFNEPGNYRLEVFNSIGKRLQSLELRNVSSGKNHAVNLSAYGKGIYVLNLFSQDGLIQRKVVVT